MSATVSARVCNAGSVDARLRWAAAPAAAALLGCAAVTQLVPAAHTLITVLCVDLVEHARSMSLSGLTRQLQRLAEGFARPTAEAADVQQAQEEASAFYQAALTVAASAAGRAASAAERAALLRCGSRPQCRRPCCTRVRVD